jgi:hypothetical protein
LEEEVKGSFTFYEMNFISRKMNFYVEIGKRKRMRKFSIFDISRIYEAIQ